MPRHRWKVIAEVIIVSIGMTVLAIIVIISVSVIAAVIATVCVTETAFTINQVFTYVFGCDDSFVGLMNSPHM